MKTSLKLIGLCLIMAVLAGCGGPSQDKIEEVRSVYEQLVDKHNEVIEAYAAIDDDSLSIRLDGMAEDINEIGQQDIKERSDKEIDAIIEDLKNHIAAYDEILQSVKQLNGDKEEAEAVSVSVTIRNNTGVDLGAVYLYQESSKDKGVNLVEDRKGLGGYDALSILNLTMTKEEMVWHLEAQDINGNVIESADIGFDGYEGKEVTVNMEYSFDSMEGWIELE